MGGIADQSQALGRESTRHCEAERVYAAGADHRNLTEAQPEAALELAMEFIVRQSNDALGLVRALGPHDGRAATGQRQNGEGARRQKMLLGLAPMITLVRHG